MGYNKMYLECLKGNDTINFYKKYGGKGRTNPQIIYSDGYGNQPISLSGQSTAIFKRVG